MPFVKRRMMLCAYDAATRHIVCALKRRHRAGRCARLEVHAFAGNRRLPDGATPHYAPPQKSRRQSRPDLRRRKQCKQQPAPHPAPAPRSPRQHAQPEQKHRPQALQSIRIPIHNAEHCVTSGTRRRKCCHKRHAHNAPPSERETEGKCLRNEGTPRCTDPAHPSQNPSDARTPSRPTTRVPTLRRP